MSLQVLHRSARKAFHEFVQVGRGKKFKAVQCCWRAEWERRRGKKWSQRNTQGLSPGRLGVTSLILRITGSPCGWWANRSGSWCGRGHLHSSGSWVSADRHSSGSGVDHASEMLFIWLTAEFICSITYLISLTKKKKNILFHHVLFGFYFDSSDFYTIWQSAVSARRNICQQEWHKWYFFQNHDIGLMWHVSLSAASEMLKLNVSSVSDPA